MRSFTAGDVALTELGLVVESHDPWLRASPLGICYLSRQHEACRGSEMSIFGLGHDWRRQTTVHWAT